MEFRVFWGKGIYSGEVGKYFVSDLFSMFKETGQPLQSELLTTERLLTHAESWTTTVTY